MSIDLYYLPASAPCRAVLLTAKAIGVDLNLKLTDVTKGEHLTPEFININPQHTIPTMIDNGFTLWESRAITTYLVDRYAKNDLLYPKDPKKRALVNQRLFFDIGTLYARFSDYYYPVIFAGGEYDPAKLEKIKEAFGLLETFLQNQSFVAGNQLSVADFSLLATVTTFEAVNFDLSLYKNVGAWLARIKDTTPGYDEANGKGVEIFRRTVETLLKK